MCGIHKSVLFSTTPSIFFTSSFNKSLSFFTLAYLLSKLSSANLNALLVATIKGNAGVPLR